MGVKRGDVVAMLEDNRAAVTAFPSRKLHTTCAGRLDGGSWGGAIVGALVRTNHIQNRVAPLQIERRGYPRVDRRAQECLTHALAVGVVIIAVAITVGVE